MMIEVETGYVYYEGVLDIECVCGHIGIFDGYRAYVARNRGVGCYMCHRKDDIIIVEMEIGEVITWGHVFPHPDREIKIRFKRFH